MTGTARFLLFAALCIAPAMLAQHPPPGGPGMPPQGGHPQSTGTPPLRTGPFLGPPGRFWDEKGFIRDVKLTPAQQKKMDEVFEAAKPNLLALFDLLRREEATARALSGDALQDEGRVLAVIDRVNQARNELEKANARLLVQLRRELDPAQLNRLDQMRYGPPPPPQ